ncbi:MAG TPA: DUF4333 domain-containing protein [Beutenbergiaceae bacterium]|nr:DUF4333 domain-containing protein [Beutenbergiaceae bacterium]
MRTRVVTVGVAGLFLLAGCSNAVDQIEVEEQTAHSLTQLLGEVPEVLCPEDLEAKVGTEMVCAVYPVNEDAEYEAYLTVTAVEGDIAHFDIELSEPLG